MGEVNIRSVFKISWNLNSFWYFHLASFFQLFFFKAVFLPYIALLKIWWELFLFPSFPFFSFWILFSSSLNSCTTTTLRQIDQIPSWNTMDKDFKKERLIKRLNRVTSNNVSRKKNKNTYMAQSGQKWLNLISQRLV